MKRSTGKIFLIRLMVRLVDPPLAIQLNTRTRVKSAALTPAEKSGLYVTDSVRVVHNAFSESRARVILSNAKDSQKKRFFGVPPQNDRQHGQC